MIPSYPSTPHWPESLRVHRDDSYHRNPEWFLDKPVVITEKLDGGVTGISAGAVYARSSDLPTHEPWFSYVKSVTLPKLYEVPANLVAWGEDLFGIHSIEYDPLPDSYFLFHVLGRAPENVETAETSGDRFWAWDNVMVFARQYGLMHVPVVFEGTFQKVEEITEFFMDHVGKPSVLGPSREGFVLRVQDGFGFDQFGTNVCKFVRANHVQTTKHWKRHWRPARIAKDEQRTPDLLSPCEHGAGAPKSDRG